MTAEADNAAAMALIADAGFGAETITEAVRGLIAELALCSPGRPNHFALRALDRLTRQCGDGEVRFIRADGPPLHDDENLVKLVRERGACELRVTVNARGRVCAELTDEHRNVHRFKIPEADAAATLLWLGQLFAGEIPPESWTM